MATTPEGVHHPIPTDAYDPAGDMGDLASSLSGRLIVPVPNTAARNALAAQLSPTSAKPLYVHREDAPTGFRTEFTEDGTNWGAVNHVRTDQPFILRRGSAVGTTAANGTLNIVFGATFPAVPAVVVSPGATTSGLGQVACTDVATVSGQQVICRTQAGAAVASAIVRVNWIAIGSVA